MRITRPLVSLLLAFILANVAGANIDLYEFSSEQKRLDYQALTKELRCPKCQNQDIADSNAPIASDMRREVHRLLEEGKDQDQIVQFMIDRFGDFVTYKPKVSKQTLVLWYGPWVFIALGIVIIFVVVKKRNGRKLNASESPEIDSKNAQAKTRSDEKRIQNLLKEYDSPEDQDRH